MNTTHLSRLEYFMIALFTIIFILLYLSIIYDLYIYTYEQLPCAISNCILNYLHHNSSYTHVLIVLMYNTAIRTRNTVQNYTQPNYIYSDALSAI